MAGTNKFSYQPLPGGDVTLKSADGVAFLAHSSLLGMSSSVFANMLSTANQSDVVELSDDAESVSLMLRFIYPPTFLDDLPFTLLEKSLLIAQKYDIAGIITSVDHLLSHPSKKNSPLWAQPLQAFCLATVYGLVETHKAAIEALQPNRYVFDKTSQIKDLTKSFPSATKAIELLGAHSIRMQKLLSVFFIHPNVILPNTRDHAGLICSDCWIKYEFPEEVSVSFRPGWWRTWSELAFRVLATEPFEKARRVFNLSITHELANDPLICSACVDSTQDPDGKMVFCDWASDTESTIIETLKPLEELQ